MSSYPVLWGGFTVALERTNGRLRLSAELCGVTRDAVYKAMHRNADLRAQVTAIRERSFEREADSRKSRVVYRLNAA